MSPNMLRGLMVLTALSSCVLSLPVTRSQLENEDVKVMKCIVEALADVLSKQQHNPVGQDCLETLKTDDRLVTILRHHNFLKELQEIAVQGDQERAQLQKDAETPTTTQSLPTTDEAADRSMLEALGGPGERSILAQKKRDESEEGVKRMEEESEEKRANSGEDSEEEEGKGGEKKDAPRNKSEEKRVNDEEEEEEKRSAHKQQEEEEEEEMKRGSREGPRRWTKRTKAVQVKRKEVPHHSKELTEEEEQQEEEEEQEQKKKKGGGNHRSPEEKELQMIARRPPEERRAMEEEGSASRKSEDPEIESLAAIESELENVAQKLHELRRG